MDGANCFISAKKFPSCVHTHLKVAGHTNTLWQHQPRTIQRVSATWQHTLQAITCIANFQSMHTPTHHECLHATKACNSGVQAPTHACTTKSGWHMLQLLTAVTCMHNHRRTDPCHSSSGKHACCLHHGYKRAACIHE